MFVKCYACEYARIPEYMEIKDSDDNTYMISLGEPEKEDEESFECPEAELLGDIADEYETETECLENILKSVSNDFECGIFWGKVIFKDDNAEIVYSVIDGESNIAINKFRKNEKIQDIDKKEDAEKNIEEVSVSGDILYENLKPDNEYIENDDVIIVNGQEYCSFKKLAKLTESLSADDRIKLMKSMEKAKEQSKQQIKTVRNTDEEPEL